MAERTQTDAVWDGSGQITSTGSANAYVLTISQPQSGYYQGFPQIRFKANFTNSGSATVDFITPNFPAGLGPVTLKKAGGASNLASGDIVSGGLYTLSHDGTFFQVLELNGVSGAATTLGGMSLSSSGDRWGVIPFVFTDGVMEVGTAIDFHGSDADATDRILRVESSDGSGLFFTPTTGASSGVLRRAASIRNSTAADGDLIYYSGGTFERLAVGTSAQVLGGGTIPAWRTAITVGTVQATTSGTAFDFTSLPAAIKRLTVMIDSVSLSGTDNLIVQIGDSGGISASGYTSVGGINTGAAVGAASSTAGFAIALANAARTFTGQMVLTRMTGNQWISSHNGADGAGNNVQQGGGNKTLSGDLDRIRLTRTGTNTFDGASSSVNIMYEL